MTPTTLWNVFSIFVSLIGIWLLVFWLYRDFRVDLLRQRLFTLRQELFDYASSGAITFHHPAYGLLRTRINSMIRFAHRFNSFQLLLVGTMPAPEQKELPTPYGRWLEALETIHDADVRTRLEQFNTRMFVTLVWHLVTGSPLLMCCLAVFGICSLLTGTIRMLLEKFTAVVPIVRLELQAEEADTTNVIAA